MWRLRSSRRPSYGWVHCDRSSKRKGLARVQSEGPIFRIRYPKKTRLCAKKWEESSIYIWMAVIASEVIPRITDAITWPVQLSKHLRECWKLPGYSGTPNIFQKYSNGIRTTSCSDRHIYATGLILLWRKLVKTHAPNSGCFVHWRERLNAKEAPTKQAHLSGSTWHSHCAGGGSHSVRGEKKGTSKFEEATFSAHGWAQLFCLRGTSKEATSKSGM